MDSFSRQMEFLKRTGEDYSQRIQTEADFGSEIWLDDLKDAFDNKFLSEPEYQYMRDFAVKNRVFLGKDEFLKDGRWGVLNSWIKELPFYNAEAWGKELTLETVSFYRKCFESDRTRLNEEKQKIIWFAFDDIDETTENAKTEILNEMEEEDKLHRFNTTSLLLFLAFLLFSFMLPGIILIATGEGSCESFFGFLLECFLGLGIVSLFLGVIYYPVAIMGSMVLSSFVAKRIVYGDEDPGERQKQAEASLIGGAIIGGIHAGISCGNELRKPGWIKDSK